MKTANMATTEMTTTAEMAAAKMTAGADMAATVTTAGQGGTTCRRPQKHCC